MHAGLKLNAIEQEHLQELYDAAGVARDELPYTPEFDALCQGFQDRTFKNADPEQVYGALLKYVRSSTCSSGHLQVTSLTKEQTTQLKDAIRRHATGGRILPYSSEFEAVMKDFVGSSKLDLSSRDFWLVLSQVHGRSRRPGKRAASRAASDEADADDAD